PGSGAGAVPRHDRAAGRLPGGDPAGEIDHVVDPVRLQQARGDGAPRAALAVDDEGPVDRDLVEPVREVAQWNMDEAPARDRVRRGPRPRPGEPRDRPPGAEDPLRPRAPTPPTPRRRRP